MVKNIRKNKRIVLADGGGILLEMLFMVVVLMIIFPLMQKDVKRRTDEIRNAAVVKDLTKLKSAVEEYLRRKPTFNKNIVDIDKKTLVDNGLPSGFNMTNILGQNYIVRVKVSENPDGSPIYEAIVLASGEGTDIPPLRIRDIVKDVKGGYAGYVDGAMVYGPDWQFPITGWGDGLNESSIVMRTGFSRKEYQYVSRKPGFGSSTMQADLYMSNHDINNVGGFFVNGGAEFKSAELGTVSGNNDSFVDDLSVTKNLQLWGDMRIYMDLNFPNGLNFPEHSLLGETVPVVYLEDSMNVAGNVSFVEENVENKIRSMDVNGIGGTAMKVANSLVFDGTDGVLGVQNLIANSVTVNKSALSRGMTFSSIRSASNDDVSITGGGVNLYDVIVRDLNSALISAGFRKIGGIDITESTPLSVILRGIFYQYQDIYKLVHNGYDDSILPGWYPNLFRRCEYSSCSGQWYY